MPSFFCFLSLFSLHGQERDTLSRLYWRDMVHGFALDFRPAGILPTSPFLRGDNPKETPVCRAFSGHAKYAFRYRNGSFLDRLYGGVYQGVGIGLYTFGETEWLGNPVTFYLFQGARIASIGRQISFNYEWNFGLSAGWHPYHPDKNPANKIMGSKLNAYLNTNFYFRWAATQRLALHAGVTFVHFSNGNTLIPNAGLNALGGKIGLDYYFLRQNRPSERDAEPVLLPPFRPYVSWDVLFFGSWKRRGFEANEGQVLSPEAYPVFGFQVSPMYNLGYKLRLGIALDGVYDGGANVRVDKENIRHDGTFQRSDIIRPELYEQLALGVSGRVEYVMPFFTVGIGMGINVLGKQEFKAFYQTMALKVDVAQNVFLHIGYNLQKFRTPNHLMLGVGFRFSGRGYRI